jgi:hypothetical protein
LADQEAKVASMCAITEAVKTPVGAEDITCVLHGRAVIGNPGVVIREMARESVVGKLAGRNNDHRKDRKWTERLRDYDNKGGMGKFYNVKMFRAVSYNGTTHDSSEHITGYRAGTLCAMYRTISFVQQEKCVLCEQRFAQGRYNTAHCLMECKQIKLVELRDRMFDSVEDLLGEVKGEAPPLVCEYYAQVSDELQERWKGLTKAGGFLLTGNKKHYRAIPCARLYNWICREWCVAKGKVGVEETEVKRLETESKTRYGAVLGAIAVIGIDMLELYKEMYIEKTVAAVAVVECQV